ncbi:MAG: YdcF family protein [Okeania sp. SIO3I5]|uniref:YdcF family protein n=1 Tax=Okeania sp. SIO3I5 TaxID=2607805 RepID=UPI0013B6D8EC|nr:YdcF family protein [Okeania sp. SIO3I5]NEQ35353.1 YdcF family protein [Okeania sp. SIO3I5]
MVVRVVSSKKLYKGLKISRISWFLVGFLVTFWFGYQQFAGSIEPPQALLVLGGAIEREVFAAEFAQQHPHLDIWVSSGTNPEYAEWLFSQAGISQTRLHLDYDAVDTVTNFTTIVDKLKSQGITSVYLVTSDDHMRRARVIGQIILGSRGITFKPLPVPSGRSPEPIEKVIRDGIRGIVWLTTGYTGANFFHQFSP